jgi:hypothetical protein
MSALTIGKQRLLLPVDVTFGLFTAPLNCDVLKDDVASTQPVDQVRACRTGAHHPGRLSLNGIVIEYRERERYGKRAVICHSLGHQR